jgi:hypothetical protein
MMQRVLSSTSQKASLRKPPMRAKINALDARLPVRYSFMALCAFGVLLSIFSLVVFNVGWLGLAVCAVLTGVGVHDLRQTRHAILRNYPVIGHLRFLFEFIRPEIRQYFIESDAEAAALAGLPARQGRA